MYTKSIKKSQSMPRLLPPLASRLCSKNKWFLGWPVKMKNQENIPKIMFGWAVPEAPSLKRGKLRKNSNLNGQKPLLVVQGSENMAPPKSAGHSFLQRAPLAFRGGTLACFPQSQQDTGRFPLGADHFQ
jgi:hypothetical protein